MKLRLSEAEILNTTENVVLALLAGLAAGYASRLEDPLKVSLLLSTYGIVILALLLVLKNRNKKMK